MQLELYIEDLEEKFKSNFQKKSEQCLKQSVFQLVRPRAIMQTNPLFPLNHYLYTEWPTHFLKVFYGESPMN